MHNHLVHKLNEISLLPAGLKAHVFGSSILHQLLTETSYKSIPSSTRPQHHAIHLSASLNHCQPVKISIELERITSQMSCYIDRLNWASETSSPHNQHKTYYILVFHFEEAPPCPCFHLEPHSTHPNGHLT
ncbi:hypothetical protein TorRG33x02_306090 [Trema orientale]|uniref:Uncharacterized protein n=1 Tax=Trema orientale TaxID=63057 RepID=A0A2P5BWP1_TREOI|nr:hypothetical protein TorRG33x02_306090 [Trema orientale]